MDHQNDNERPNNDLEFDNEWQNIDLEAFIPLNAGKIALMGQ